MVAGSAVVRAGLRALLAEAPGFEVVDVLAPPDVDRALGDVLLFDADPGTVPSLDPEGPPIILLADDPDGVRQSELWPGRIRAVLPHTASGAEILAAVQAVAIGFVLFKADEAERVHVTPRSGQGGEALTPREVEVLQMVAAGESNKRIAWKLGISEHTAKFHVASILAKLAAGSRAEAVAIGIRRGLIYL